MRVFFSSVVCEFLPSPGFVPLACIYMESIADEKLIEAVRCFPCLWQVNSRLYRDVVAKGNALKEIANQVSACALTGGKFRAIFSL